MRIAVVGAGGVGGYFGGRLAQAGHEVHLVARGAHLAAIRRDGLRVESTLGDFTVAPAGATDDPAEIGPVDAVLVAVKGWQLQDAARSARPLLGPDTVVLPLLNGVEAADVLAGVLGRGPVLGGVCRIVSSIVEPGRIRHAAMEPAVVLGTLDGAASPEAERLAGALDGAEGVDAELTGDVHGAIWRKFMLIATWSGIGAVTRAPVGVWRSLPGTRSMAEEALREILALARARGIDTRGEWVAATLDFIDGVAPHGTASMQRDIMEGRPSELESQNGAAVRLAAEAGVPVPVNRFLYHSLLPQERAARGLDGSGGD